MDLAKPCYTDGNAAYMTSVKIYNKCSLRKGAHKD